MHRTDIRGGQHTSEIQKAQYQRQRLNLTVKMILKRNLYLFGRRGGGEREREYASSSGSFPTCPEQLELGEAEAKIQEPHLGLPCGWQGAKDLSHHCCPPGGAHAGS